MLRWPRDGSRRSGSSVSWSPTAPAHANLDDGPGARRRRRSTRGGRRVPVPDRRRVAAVEDAARPGARRARRSSSSSAPTAARSAACRCRTWRPTAASSCSPTSSTAPIASSRSTESWRTGSRSSSSSPKIRASPTAPTRPCASRSASWRARTTSASCWPARRVHLLDEDTDDLVDGDDIAKFRAVAQEARRALPRRGGVARPPSPSWNADGHPVTPIDAGGDRRPRAPRLALHRLLMAALPPPAQARFAAPRRAPSSKPTRGEADARVTVVLLDGARRARASRRASPCGASPPATSTTRRSST